ncbi:MAG: 3-dehydroquinate synthase [Alphaproteobacteria bacterium]|jgi:3-dehydroquinate synthase
MSKYSTIEVALGDRSYEIRVGEGLLAAAGEHLGPLLGEHTSQRRVTIITDTNVAALHLTTVEQALSAADIGHRTVVLDPGEHTKDFDHLSRLIDDLLDRDIERSSMLVALGGGVVGDLTGFAAAIALRGIDFVQLPTTLLSQVDSSVGGKTGINTRHGKNLVGAFYQPRMVLADIGVLDTLPRRELLSGYAEVAKYGVINDAGFFQWLENHGTALIDGDPQARQEAVTTSCQAKANIVSSDEREQGERALLNLGHTFGHAMEAETGFSDTLIHGEAVAIGMVLALALSERTGLCPPGRAARLKAHLDAVGLPSSPKGYGFTADNLIAHMRHDKKVHAGSLTFILANDIGQGKIVRDVLLEDVACLLQDSLV